MAGVRFFALVVSREARGGAEIAETCFWLWRGVRANGLVIFSSRRCKNVILIWMMMRRASYKFGIMITNCPFLLNSGCPKLIQKTLKNRPGN